MRSNINVVGLKENVYLCMRCICVNNLYLCLVPVAHLGGGATRIGHSQREEDRRDPNITCRNSSMFICAILTF